MGDTGKRKFPYWSEVESFSVKRENVPGRNPGREEDAGVRVYQEPSYRHEDVAQVTQHERLCSSNTSSRVSDA